jgi:5-methylcytosine-specific restriction endonuclease McrA
MLHAMGAGVAANASVDQTAEAWPASHAPPKLDFEPFTTTDLRGALRGGERAADECEALLAWAARARTGIDVAIAEGLDALRQGERLAQLGCHLDDYGREALDIGERTVRNLARLGRELPRRPLLREALRSGRVRLRAAETVLSVAIGDTEAEWVDRAGRLTVRELEHQVRRARAGDDDADEPSLGFRARLRPEERLVVDEALELAGRIDPGSTRAQRLEALAQEFLAEVSMGGDEDDAGRLEGAFRRLGPGEEPRRAALEVETERWTMLPAVLPWQAPVGFDEHATAQEIDARLRELARLRAGWDDVIGMPRRIAVLLNAAVAAVRERADRVVSTGKCLAIIAWHFIETWKGAVKPARTRSRKVRERDEGHCQVPGCSHPGAHAHHVEFRSHGGGDELENQVALCPFHHLRCVHGGYLRVVGRAPDELSWFLLGSPWRGPGA